MERCSCNTGLFGLRLRTVMAAGVATRVNETIGREAGWLMLLVIISIFCAGLPSVGHGGADPLTPEQRAWLNQHDGKIIVNNEAGWPPIIDTDKEGNSFGIVMDYQNLIEKKLGFKFKFDKLDRWENFMGKVSQGRDSRKQQSPKNAGASRICTFHKTIY